jgi:hypothetical protein
MPVNDGDVPDYNDERARHEREKRLLAELARQEKEQRIPHLEVEEIEVITGLIREALEELANGEVKA